MSDDDYTGPPQQPNADGWYPQNHENPGDAATDDESEPDNESEPEEIENYDTGGQPDPALDYGPPYPPGHPNHTPDPLTNHLFQEEADGMVNYDYVDE